MKLSTSLEDAITGGDECRGRDSQLTAWAEEARRLEAALEWIAGQDPVRHLGHCIYIASEALRGAEGK